MRVRVAELVLLVGLLTAPLGSSGFLEDPAGDVVLTSDGEPVQPVTERTGHVDLRGLAIEETPESLVFSIDLEALDETGVMVADTTDHEVSFTIGEAAYVLQVRRAYYVDAPGPADHSAELYRAPLGGPFDEVGDYPVEVDEADALLSASVPRTDLIDADGAKAAPGTVLAGLRVRSLSSALFPAALAQGSVEILTDPFGLDNPVPLLQIEDAMPDSGTVDYEVRSGAGVSNGFTLEAEEPARTSNGEATTLLYVLNLRNDQVDDRTVHFEADGVPSGWDVWFPAEGATAAAGTPMEVPVLVRMPFAHTHGDRKEWTVRVTDAADETVYAEVELAVAFTAVPQPSGHHPRLWIHTAQRDDLGPVHSDDVFGGRALPFMNTLEEDGDGDPAGPNDFFPPNSGGGWRIPLKPGLGMGLAFQPGAPSDLEFTVRTNLEPLIDATWEVRLVHVSAAGQETVLAKATSNATSMDPRSERTFALRMAPTSVDRVPYTPRAGLELHIWPVNPDGTNVQHMAFGADLSLLGGTVLLPLREYHDDIEGAFSDLRTLLLGAEAQELPVNPGETVLFPAVLENRGAADLSLDLSLTGPAAEHATVHPPHVVLPAGGSAEVSVAVMAPGDAVHDAPLDVVLTAEGDGVRALLRLVARVDTETDHEDLQDLVPKGHGQESPGLGTVTGIAVLALLAVVRARRPEA